MCKQIRKEIHGAKQTRGRKRLFLPVDVTERGECDRPLRQAQEEEDFWLVQADSYGHLTKCRVEEILPIDCSHPTCRCLLLVSVPSLFALFPFSACGL